MAWQVYAFKLHTISGHMTLQACQETNVGARKANNGKYDKAP
jgi:hypothetical protein